MTTDPNAIANAIVAGVDAVPAELHGSYTVWLDGRTYDVSFTRGRPDRVQVTYTRETFRYGGGRRQTRWVWGNDYRNPQDPKPGTVPAKLVAMVRDPAVAKAAGAKVESPAQREARYKAMDRKLRAEEALQARENVVRDAAPAMLEALKALVAEIEAQGDTALYAPQYRAAKNAIVQAEG